MLLVQGMSWPLAYNNATIHYSHIDGKGGPWATVRSKHPALDGEVIMRVGGGKKHGRYCIGNNTLDTAATPTLSKIRVRSASSSLAIRPRPNTAQSRMEALHVISVPFVVH